MGPPDVSDGLEVPRNPEPNVNLYFSLRNLDRKNCTQIWPECTWYLFRIVANKKASFTLVQFIKHLPELVLCRQPVTRPISSCQSNYHLIKIPITGCDVQQHSCARSIFKCTFVHVYFYTANKYIFINSVFLCAT